MHHKQTYKQQKVKQHFSLQKRTLYATKSHAGKKDAHHKPKNNNISPNSPKQWQRTDTQSTSSKNHATNTTRHHRNGTGPQPRTTYTSNSRMSTTRSTDKCNKYSKTINYQYASTDNHTPYGTPYDARQRLRTAARRTARYRTTCAKQRTAYTSLPARNATNSTLEVLLGHSTTEFKNT